MPDNINPSTTPLDATAATTAAPNAPVQQSPDDTTPLVLGILSIVFTGIIGLVLSIIGLNFSKKALAVQPQSSKVKAGRVCSIVGLVLSIIAIVSIVVAFSLFGVGLSIFGGDVSAVNKTANQTLDEITNPSESDRLDIADYFDSAFEANSGISLADLGIDNGEFSDWLFEGASYTITDTSLDTVDDISTATVTADVTAHSLMDLSDAISIKVDAIDAAALSSAASPSDFYAVIGQAVSEAMAETPASTKSVTMSLTKEDGIWYVDEGVSQGLAYEVYAS